MAQLTGQWKETVKLCALKGSGENRECDKENCQFWNTQHSQCMVYMFLRALVEKGGM